MEGGGLSNCNMEQKDPKGGNGLSRHVKYRPVKGITSYAKYRSVRGGVLEFIKCKIKSEDPLREGDIV